VNISKSGLRKIERAIAAGFIPGNGWHGPGAFLSARKTNKKRRAKK
jgi:hypothetical protein